MSELIVATGEELVRVQAQDGRWQASKLSSGRRMQCLAADPRNPDVLYAGSHGGGVWRSTSRGRDWARLEFPEANVFSLAVSPVDGAVYAGTEPSKLFVSRNEGRSWRELKALQDIPSRPAWSFPPRPWTSHVRSIAPSPHDARLLLAGIELGGVMRSEDGGETWSDHRPGAQKDVHALAWHPTAPGRAYEAGGGGPPGAATAGSPGSRPTRAGTATTPGAWPSIPATPTAGTSPRTRAPGWHTTVSRARRRTSIAGAGTVRGSRSAADYPSPWTAFPTPWRWDRTPCSPGWGTGGFTGAKTGAIAGSSWTSTPPRRPAYWDWS